MAEISNTRKGHGREARLGVLAIFASLAAMLAPSTTQARNAADGYRFEQAEFIRTNFQVAVVEYESAAAVTDAAKKAGALFAATQVGNYGRAVPSRVLAWSRLRDGVCEIHIISAKVEYRPDLFGHELAHCIYGRWHPSRP